MDSYREIRSLKPEEQGRALKVLRDRGHLAQVPASVDRSALWCGHPRSAILKDGKIEYCGICSAQPGESL